jgi:S-adenosylmethionine:tRNA ribosyltransferase-isomerase
MRVLDGDAATGVPRPNAAGSDVARPQPPGAGRGRPEATGTGGARTEGPLVRSSVAPFRIPDGAEAGTPPELRADGQRPRPDARTEVRLMVARRAEGTVTHHRFADLTRLLRPGDLLVVNTSAVIPAAIDARPAGASGGAPVRLHLSTEQPGGFWVVEPRRPAGAGTERWRGPLPSRLDLAGGGRVHLLAPYPADGSTTSDPATPPRLWLARLDLPDAILAYLAAHGQPIRYAHTDDAWPLDAYQSVFSRVPGSAEMPSAARPFTHALVTELVTRGVGVVPVTLHTGVSSQEAGEPPYAERYAVPPATAAQVTAARRDGRRVIAVGTTVVRALETTADDRGRAHPGRGWTELVVTPERGVRVVDGLITGWHEPESSHLAMLEAVAGPSLLDRSYAAAVDHGYLWHEFGDSHLILP